MSEEIVSASSIASAYPDWVMLGSPQPSGKVWLIASRELTDAELRAETRRQVWEEDTLTPHPWGPPRTTVRLTATMRTFHIIEAATYREAFAALFEVWQPDEVRALPGPEPPG